jgi:hypothetical protein
VWVHESIAEVYSFGLMILAGLFLIALWREPIRGRVYWLALLGGIGAFHHRAIAMMAPALIYAVWGEIVATSANPHPPTPSPLHGFTRRHFWYGKGISSPPNPLSASQRGGTRQEYERETHTHYKKCRLVNPHPQEASHSEGGNHTEYFVLKS